MRNPVAIAHRTLAVLASALLLSACDSPRAEVEIVGMQAGVSRQQYLAMPDSVRLEQEEDAASSAEARGVTVDVALRIDGHEGSTLPLAYTLHDARNRLPFISRKVPIAPDAPKWSRRATLWLPVLSAGTYYVQVVLADSTGRETDGPRTEDFTVQ